MYRKFSAPTHVRIAITYSKLYRCHRAAELDGARLLADGGGARQHVGRHGNHTGGEGPHKVSQVLARTRRDPRAAQSAADV